MTSLEARALIDDYRVHVWPEHKLDVQGLAAACDGIPEDVATRLLDAWHEANHTPPTPHQLRAQIDKVNAPERIADIIATTRQNLQQPRKGAA